MSTELTNYLSDWMQLAQEIDWSALLIGNGLSQNIWKKFGYTSLYETATNAEKAPLVAEDIELFEKFHTHNFEYVLSALATSLRVAEALGRETHYIMERASSIRNALISAVHSVHIPRHMIDDEKLKMITVALRECGSIYVTNYDLICYWALMQESGGFSDFFFSPPKFDITNTEVWGGKTRVHFLHGGLHLYRKPSGMTLKRSAKPPQSLLDFFGVEFDGALPLFVSEGSSTETLASLYRSDYLSYLFGRFCNDDCPIVVFGHALGESDQHIVDVLNSKPKRRIAVSVLNTGDIRQKKASIIKSLPNADLTFFASSTHPIGSPDLIVEAEA